MVHILWTTLYTKKNLVLVLVLEMVIEHFGNGFGANFNYIGKLTLVDPRGTKLEKYSGAYMLKPNRFELSAIIGMPTDTSEQIHLAANEVKMNFKFDTVLVTQDKVGMTLVDKDSQIFFEPSDAKLVVDDVGAGDTVIATMAIGLSLKIPAQALIHLASEAAAIVIGKSGTAEVTLEELRESFVHRKIDSKIVSLGEAESLVAKWRREGNKIAFTNGCFDLLHVGHIFSFQKGKSGSNKLIVGLNSDASIKCLKGNQRPIESQDLRSMALCLLDIIDLVIIFGDDTPMDLIKKLKPDVLFKSLPHECIVGASFVESYGGTVKSIPLVPGFSTTETVAKVGISQEK